MPSTIDTTKPVNGSRLDSSVIRDRLVEAKHDIEAGQAVDVVLQNLITALQAELTANSTADTALHNLVTQLQSGLSSNSTADTALQNLVTQLQSALTANSTADETDHAALIAAISAISTASSFTNVAIVDGVLTLNCGGANNFIVSHNQNITSVAFTNVPSGVMYDFTLTLVQDSTGGRTIAAPSSFKMMNDALALNVGVNKTSIITASTIDGGVTWLAHWSKEV